MNRALIITSLFFASAVGAGAVEDAALFPFRVGEKLTYQVFWGPFVVGRASLEVAGVEPVDGHDCYHLIALVKTSGLAEALFPVNNKVESWLDTEALFTRRFHEERSEGKHKRSDTTQFDYEKKQTTTTNLSNGKVHLGPLPAPVQDVISSLYYVRTQPLKLDADEQFMLNAVDTNLVVNVRPDQRKELHIRPLGDVQALRLEPKPTLNVVAANKGRMWFWISDDARRLPLLVTTEMKLGSAKLVLFQIESAKPTLDKNIKLNATGTPSPPVAGKTPLAATP